MLMSTLRSNPGSDETAARRSLTENGENRRIRWGREGSLDTSVTVLLVYYSGHGASSNATEVLISEFDEVHYFFPLKQRLYEIAQLLNVFVI